MPTRKQPPTHEGQRHGAELAERRILSLSLVVLRVDSLAYALEQELPPLATLDQTDEQLREEGQEAIRRMSPVPIIRAQAFFTLMLGSLYAVVEKWRQWHFADPAVDGLLSQTAYVERLGEYRHAVFHDDHYDHQAIHSLFLDDEMRAWTAELTAALRAYCRHWHAEPATHLRDYLKQVEA